MEDLAGLSKIFQRSLDSPGILHFFPVPHLPRPTRVSVKAKGLSPDDLAEGDPGGRAARAAWIFGDGRCWGDAGALQ